eukprot:TRINITY_DN3238_c0_g1_i1.p1 TRINITY_DN3238_c0_g1~~TRINITY_DN3238_c0_g1_i1.p1  ORF type:complete len:268 (-),score=48.92 TRINITY_DN3238_c0_g1_i1:18-821(-)
MNKQREASRRVKLSKAMSHLLRHSAEKEKVPISADGFVKVDDMLRWRRIAPLNVTLEEVEEVVQNCAKQRFTLEMRSDGAYVRANQGHSMDVNIPNRPVTCAEEYPCVVHGTYLKNWAAIKKSGLNKMSRQHIHMALGDKGEVKSGFRDTCNVLVYIDLARALEAGIPFEVSSNNVMLSPGLDGVIPPEYFARVVDIANGIELYPNEGTQLENWTRPTSATSSSSSSSSTSSSSAGSGRGGGGGRRARKKKRAPNVVPGSQPADDND